MQHVFSISKGPTRYLGIGIGSLFSISPNPYSYQFSHAHQFDPRSSTIGHCLPVASASLHSSRRRRQHRQAWTPLRPCTGLYLRTSLPLYHPSIPPSQRRNCHDPASYSSFPPPLPGELGNPPLHRARAALRRPWHAYPDPILNPRSDFTSGTHSPIRSCMICSSVLPSTTTHVRRAT